MFHSRSGRGRSHGLLAIALNDCASHRIRIALAVCVVYGHLVATVRRGLLELISVHLLHLNPLSLLIREAMSLAATSFDWQMMIVLSVMLGCATVVTLGVSLACMGAFLLDEHSFEAGSCTAVCHHHLLRVVEHLWVVNTTRARILLLSNATSELVLLLYRPSGHHLLIRHVALALVSNACGTFTASCAFVMDPGALD